MTTTEQARGLHDTAAVADLMDRLRQSVRAVPTALVSDQERLLRARLVLEEALEFVAAMGCVAVTPGHDIVDKSTEVLLDEARGIDLVEATDAMADLTVVVKGSALTLGVPVDAAFDIVHATNLAKIPDGSEPILRADGKAQKPAGWQPPTAALHALLVRHGWDPAEQATG